MSVLIEKPLDDYFIIGYQVSLTHIEESFIISHGGTQFPFESVCLSGFYMSEDTHNKYYLVFSVSTLNLRTDCSPAA